MLPVPKLYLGLPFSPPDLAIRHLTGVVAQLALAPAGMPGLRFPEAGWERKAGRGRDFLVSIPGPPPFP